MQAARSWIPYCGEAPPPELWLNRWNLDPVLCGFLVLLAIVLWRPLGWQTAAVQRQHNALRSAWVLTALLYVSPLCALSSAFFTVRVVHHMALVLVVAPLLAFGLEPWLRRLPTPLWPCTALAAIAFWVAVRRSGPAGALAAILATTVLMGLLGALITFATRPLYPPHFASTLSWGIAPLEDQQLAGIVMWAPGSFAYLVAAVWIGWRWLRVEPERRLRVEHERRSRVGAA